MDFWAAIALAYEADMQMDEVEERLATLETEGNGADPGESTQTVRRTRRGSLPAEKVDLACGARAIEALEQHFERSADPEIVVWARYLALRTQWRASPDRARPAADRAAAALAERGAFPECDVAILLMRSHVLWQAGDEALGRKDLITALGRLEHRASRVPEGDDRQRFLGLPWHRRLVEAAMARRFTIDSSLLVTDADA